MPRIRVRGAAPALPITTDVSPEVSGGEGWDVGTTLAGGLGLAAAGYVANKLGAKSLLGKLLRGANTVRQQSMLSGLATPKSILGNVGAAGIASAERGSMAPLRELFSKATARDVAATYKANVPYPGASATPNWLPTPGRVMGAFDTATQNALQRAGLSAKEAAREVLQAPLPKRLAESLEGPVAQYLIPFRRTPFNQLMEGLQTVTPANIAANPKLSAAVGAAGAAHGYITSNDRYPLTIGLGTALASRYGVPYAVAAMIGRKLAGARTSGSIAGSMLPVSEYGITSGIEEPLRPFTEPAALTALQRLRGQR